MDRSTMEAFERQSVLDQLVLSEVRLLEMAGELTPAQWNFREAPQRWSIAENVEHLIEFENFIRRAIANALAGPPEPDKKTSSLAKEPLVLGLANSRGTKFNAREAVRPIGRWSDTTEMIAELRRSRAKTLKFAAETQAALRDHFFPHIALGDLDCYQWLVVLSQHTVRHTLQIKEIIANPAYPAT